MAAALGGRGRVLDSGRAVDRLCQLAQPFRPGSSRIGVRHHIVVSQATRMTHATRFVASAAVLVALALCVPVQAQTPEIDALRVLAEAGEALSS